MKPYLFAYSQLCPDMIAQQILNDSNAVSYWVQPFPNAAIVTSSLNVKDLSAVLRNRLGATWFMVSELSPASVDGWLPGDLWQLVSAPTISSSRELIPTQRLRTKAHADGRGQAA